MVDTVVEEEASEESPSFNNSLLSRLCKFYSDCLHYDDSAEIKVFAKDRSGNAAWFDIGSGTEPSALSDELVDARLTDTAGFPEFVAAGRRDLRKTSLYYGFPTYLQWVTSKKGWQGGFLLPLFFLRLDKVQNGQGEVWSFPERMPQVNPAVLKLLAPSPEEARDLLSDLGLLGASDYKESLVDLSKKLMELLGKDLWREELAEELTAGPSLDSLRGEGFYVRGCIFRADANRFVQGLEKELIQLAAKTDKDVQGTALSNFMNGKNSNRNTAPPKADDKGILKSVPLNDEQERAVKKALTECLTVITGPPGTGKSQVVSSIILNAAVQGKNVLFASRNHKAVDVVADRVNQLADRPLLLKLAGQSGESSKLMDYISNLLAESPRDEWRRMRSDAYNEIQGARSLISHQEFRFKRLEDALNALDRCERGVESLRTVRSERFFEFAKSKRDLDFEALWALKEKASKLAKLRGSSVGRMVWKLFSEMMTRNLLAKADRMKPEMENLELDAAKIYSLEPQQWNEFAREVDVRKGEYLEVVSYYNSLETIAGENSLENIQEDLHNAQTVESMAGLKFLNGWSLCLPDQLDRETKAQLGQYRSALEMLDSERLPKQEWARLSGQMNRAFQKVARFIPGWCVTNLSARGRIPFADGMFDLVVIDEAGQCDIASALPLLYRAKRAVIIGDPNQLQHISNVSALKENEIRRKYGLMDIEYAPYGYRSNSLFALAQTCAEQGNVVRLLEHHRSHKDIIEFSNRQFYGGQLRLATDYRKLKAEPGDAGVRWIQVAGKVVRPDAGGALNDAEAKKVAEEVTNLIREKGYAGTIGVVTPFRLQANRIRDYVNDSLTPDEIAQHLLVVDVVHKYQGDERDCMFFSPVISAQCPDSALGFLRRTGNLFNVAITRARAMLIIVGDKDACLKCGVEHLEKFADYVSALEGERQKEAQWAVQFESSWEEFLYNRLVKEGLKPMPQYVVGSYRLDLAIKIGDVSLDIEVDGERYHRDWTGALSERDRLRNVRIQEEGWRVLRFWVYQIRDDMDGCIAQIKAALPLASLSQTRL